MADGRVIIDAELNTAEFEGGLQQLDALTLAAGHVLAEVFETAISKAAQFAAGAVQVGMAYDTAMSQVAATMGTTVDQIEGLSAAARNMGATTKFTATEAAEGINILAMAGLDEAAILAENAKGTTILSTTLDLASAGAMDMAAAATYLTGAVKGFGDEASSEEHRRFHRRAGNHSFHPASKSIVFSPKKPQAMKHSNSATLRNLSALRCPELSV